VFLGVDEELFEMDPIEYIRRDIEGSGYNTKIYVKLLCMSWVVYQLYIPIDSETRRRAATDFVRGLMVLYLEQITQIIKTYVEQYLNVRRCIYNWWKT